MSDRDGIVRSVTKRSDRLLREIEEGALDSGVVLSDVLRKVIALGSRYRSPELRDWASNELNGYADDQDVPSYRMISAPLLVDVDFGFGRRDTGRPIGLLELPDFSREALAKGVPMHQGVKELEQLAASDTDVLTVNTSMMQDLVSYMNAVSYTHLTLPTSDLV